MKFFPPFFIAENWSLYVALIYFSNLSSIPARKIIILSLQAIDISVYMVSCNMIGRGKTKTKKFGREELGRPRPCARECERRPYCNAATSP